jgi:hypothetical protein
MDMHVRTRLEIAESQQLRDHENGERLHWPNENKMSDGGQKRASIGVEVWKSSQEVERTAVRRSLHRMG